VVRRILPQIPGTFKRGKWGYLRGFRAGSDIFGAVAETVSRLPNQARYQTSLSPAVRTVLYNTLGKNATQNLANLRLSFPVSFSIIGEKEAVL